MAYETRNTCYPKGFKHDATRDFERGEHEDYLSSLEESVEDGAAETSMEEK